MRDVQQTAPPGPSEFRKLMGMFPTGVCVVAVEAGDRGISAMTINSFVSVSLDPLLVCWSLHNDASQFDLYAKADSFSISILAEDQSGHARNYATRGNTGLREADFVRSEQGLPVIDGALGHFECRAWSTHRAGDHTMILGEVTGLAKLASKGARALGFFDGEFCPVPGDTGAQ